MKRHLCVVDDNGDLKASSHEYGIDDAFEDENGIPFEEATHQHRAFIVQAVNSHEELLEHLECALKLLSEKQLDGLERAWFGAARKVANKASNREVVR